MHEGGTLLTFFSLIMYSGKYYSTHKYVILFSVFLLSILNPKHRNAYQKRFSSHKSYASAGFHLNLGLLTAEFSFYIQGL